MKIIKTKTDSGLQIYSDEPIVALFCNDTIYLSFDKFKGTMQVALPEELSNWNENNIITFYSIEDCHAYINENNLNQYINTITEEEII